MRRFVKLLVLALVVAGVLALASYAGARARAGQIVGPDPPLGGREISFAFDGVATLPNQPRAWVFNYRSNRLGLRQVIIYISPKGAVLATVPRDLAERLEAYERSREP